MRRWLVLLLQCGVSAALMAWIFREEEFRGEVARLFREADWRWMAAAFATAGAGSILGIFRWIIFVRIVGIHERLEVFFRMGAAGLFFNCFLPGVVGGDAVKVAWLAARRHDAGKALLSILMDRLSGLGALVLSALILVIPKWEWLNGSRPVSMAMHFAMLYLAGAVAALGLSLFLASRGSARQLPAWMPGRDYLCEMEKTYALFLLRWKQTGLGALASAVMLMTYFLTFYFCSLALDVDVPLGKFLSFMPAVDIIAALPVSLGGFGLREGVFAVVMADLLGVSASAGVSISFAGALMAIFWGCLGALALPGYRNETKP